MKYLPLRDFDDVASALNFDTEDCHVLGGCDLYTTKAAGADKKLYKNIEHELKTQYESLLSFSAGLSPQQIAQAGSSLNLSRASPFGSFSQISSRRTFAYLIAVLNASNVDYDFSHRLRPADFRREKNVRKVINIFDTTLGNLRPRYSSSFQDESVYGFSAIMPSIPQTPQGSETWNPRMWRLIDKQMTLKDCSIYCYAPEEDPYDGEDGSVWRFDYFFFNKARKRVCYLYLRGLSILESRSFLRSPSRVKRPGSGTWSVDEDTSQKRAKYWLGEGADCTELAGDGDGAVAGARDATNAEGKEPIYIPSDTEFSDESSCKGRSRLSSSDIGSDGISKGDSPKESKEGSVRGISEEIAAQMDL